MAFQFREGTCFLGKTLVLSDGVAELQVTLDVGPRIISLSKIGGENLMFEDRGDAVNRDCSEIYGAGKMWHIYGGHRMWLSPEDESTYYPDNGAVKAEIFDNGAVFTPEKWDVAEVAPSLKIVMEGGGKFRLEHSFKNLSEKSQNLCVWVLTVLKTGGEVTVPLSREDTGLLANRNLVFWSYTDVKDSRISVENDSLKLRGVAGAETNIKIGLYLKEPKAVYRLGDTVFTKTLPYAASPERYPDFCSNLETYTSGLIHEVETLSPIESVASGGTITHIEYWEVK